ncbi:NFATC2-interacting protein isoform X2 [Cheilinus undulatus]|uniref:NFATC2-interacting protein isoform X2 n=1 Tax=Cheilinus undulatus TaxID=241271 RepID=UPI001BD35CED|nr:NFATC2-interacting protein isoform X2 [Cheilinus undulatus]
MAEALSDSEEVALKPRPKRRRILDPSAIVPVPVYSSKVSKSLQLKPMKAILTEQKDTGSVVDESLWSEFSSHNPAAAISTLSDSEEETEHEEKKTQREEVRCCSPSPPDSPVNKHSRQFLKKMSEIDRKLQAVNSLLSPEPQDNRSRRRKKILPPDSSVREIPLKIRCRTDIHKIPVLSSTPLSDVVEKLSIILKVPPPRLLLLRKDVELPTDSTVSELGLSIADIIECDVMAAEEQSAAVSSGSSITVRLQSKDRNSSQEFTLHKDAPLGSIFSQYTSNLSVINKRKLSFQFDGSKVTANQTPAQLDMEDGDIIEVWT